MNYLQIGSTRIELTDEQVNQLREGGISDIALSAIGVGESFKIADHEFIVLEHKEEGTAVILKNLLLDSEEFGENNNYNRSHVDGVCENFADKIGEIIGTENIVEHTVDLTSDDGLKDYGSITRKMSLLTTELYRRYVETLDKYKIDKWWWLATAYSTPAHEDDEWVKCVSPRGDIDSDICYYSLGVRPFCILKSNIFVSK